VDSGIFQKFPTEVYTVIKEPYTNRAFSQKSHSNTGRFLIAYTPFIYPVDTVIKEPYRNRASSQKRPRNTEREQAISHNPKLTI